MKKLAESLRGLKGATAEEIQTVVYSIGMESGMDLKNWFSCLYQVLLGAEQGPRFGSFVHLYGVQETIDMIERSLSM
jgi:lysyl-tRNA synthetase class 1